MQAEQLFVETLNDIRQKLNNNPTEYQLLKVSGLLRQILRENLLDEACRATQMRTRFRVVKPKPWQPSEEWIKAWEVMRVTHPDIEQGPNLGFRLRGGLLSGEASEPGDQVVELTRDKFLKHPVGITLSDVEYTVNAVLLVAANSLGGIHHGTTNQNDEAEMLRKYMEGEGSTWFGRSMPAAFVFEIACCTLRTCQPVADKLADLGLYSPAQSEWVWNGDGSVETADFQAIPSGTDLHMEIIPIP